ncbi:hypothetical protein GCM10022291_00770 [Postechiella marina]|uniref:Uncharacterized protein n=1 Tax=Postechiella marina TaxID=943941 RepID=A0ABP8BYJ6_9FLAO
MSFDATKTDFRNAKIRGSESEKLNFDLYQKIAELPESEKEKNRDGV